MLVGVVVVATVFAGCASTSATAVLNEETSVSAPEPGPENETGIEVVTLRLSSAGYMVDLRYRITNPDKAAGVFARDNRAYLVDQTSGLRLPVPRTTKIGPLRQTNFQPDPERLYFILFDNVTHAVQPGSLVTFEVGDYRIENLVVQ
jgi:hypothetical protein